MPTFGKESDPTCLLLHGWPDDHRIFDALVERLTTVGDAAGTKYKCVCPDFSRGKSFRDNLRVAKGILEQESALPSNKNGKVVIVGHDWGAGMMWALQDRYPQRVSRVVALSIPVRVPLISVWSHGILGVACLYQVWLGLAYFLGRFGFGPLKKIGDWMALKFITYLFKADHRNVTGPSRANLIPPATRHSLLCYYYFTFAAVFLAIQAFIPNLFRWKNRLPIPMNKQEVRVPALFMHGAKEKLWTNPEICDRICKSFPISQVHVYPKSGHWFFLHEANVQDFLDRVGKFLSS